NFFTGTRRNIEHLLEHKHFDLMRHDVTFPLYVEVDEIYNLACPASPIHYQHDPVQTTKTSVHGAINMLGLAKRLRAKILQASTSEIEPHRAALMLRRRQALRGDAFFRLLAPAPAAHQGGAHLQYLWPAHAPQRRTRGLEFHRAGAAWPRHHHLWRRPADARFLLCR